MRNRETKRPPGENPNRLSPARYNESIWLIDDWMFQAARRIGVGDTTRFAISHLYSVLPLFLRSLRLHAAGATCTGANCAGLR